MARLQITSFSELTEIERIEALERYRTQNPKKWETKKDALLKMYGLAPEAIVTPEPDEALEIAKKVAKKATKKVSAKKTS